MLTQNEIDVDSTLVVYASNEIQVQSDDSIITYCYDRTGEREEVKEEKVKTK